MWDYNVENQMVYGYDDDLHTVPCPMCNGTGKRWYAIDLVEDREIEVTELEYLDAYDDTDCEYEEPEELLKRGIRYIRNDYCDCMTCDGYGDVCENDVACYNPLYL